MLILYEFYCKACNTTFESLEVSGSKIAKCKCGEIAKKVLSSSNFKINGFSEANGYSNCEDKPCSK